MSESMEGIARNEPRCAECIARPFDVKNPHAWKDYPSSQYDDYANAKHEAWDDGAIVGFAAGRAAATPDAPCECPREAWAENAENGEWYCTRCGFELPPFELPPSVTTAGVPAASPDERLREALREIVRQVEEYPALSPTGIMVRDDIAGMVEGTARAALAAADREAPDGER